MIIFVKTTKMKFLSILFLFVALFSCISSNKRTTVKSAVLNKEEAERLVTLPLKCVEQEFPNKLGQVLNDSNDLLKPKTLHPAFYGCFDWHSSVHGHWLMVKILKDFPDIKNGKVIKSILMNHLTKENISDEIAFFKRKNNGSFERTYGWNWILKLQLELDTWQDEEGKQMASNLRPLSSYLANAYVQFLPKLQYPIRTGDHINTAFGLSFAYDYAVHSKNKTLKAAIVKCAKRFYLNDKNSPINYEPSGYDFLSPTFEEIDLMQRILPPTGFSTWLKKFLPEIYDSNFTLKPGIVKDRTDGKLVHLDGLNFSRAWCMYRLAKNDSSLQHLKIIADQHLNYSLPSIVDGDYMGEHWLATFALVALDEQRKLK